MEFHPRGEQMHEYQWPEEQLEAERPDQEHQEIKEKSQFFGMLKFVGGVMNIYERFKNFREGKKMERLEEDRRNLEVSRKLAGKEKTNVSKLSIFDDHDQQAFKKQLEKMVEQEAPDKLIKKKEIKVQKILDRAEELVDKNNALALNHFKLARQGLEEIRNYRLNLEIWNNSFNPDDNNDEISLLDQAIEVLNSKIIDLSIVTKPSGAPIGAKRLPPMSAERLAVLERTAPEFVKDYDVDQILRLEDEAKELTRQIRDSEGMVYSDQVKLLNAAVDKLKLLREYRTKVGDFKNYSNQADLDRIDSLDRQINLLTIRKSKLEKEIN
ncbi:MAG: hypothetical protein JW816_02385 [Candidatus Buchananbacteria bacterium]|nr:hypothetical protein [Candidatus Buchananbacteria bacterium]